MEIINGHPGEFAALLTAIFWTVSALAFESATLKFGSVAVNILKLASGFIFLTILTYLRRGLFLPSDAGAQNWLWLTLSGFAGFVFGDLFLFKSYAVIGSRFSMLIMTLVPPMTALFGWIMVGERLSALNLLGMTITFAGIAMAILTRDGNSNGRLVMKLEPAGILYAIGGAAGQALGLVLSKIGLKDYDPFSATQIRIISGLAGFAILGTFMKRWKHVADAVTDRNGIKSILLGSFFGPFLGVSFALISVKFTKAGIASTIMALTPVFILLPAIILYKQKVTLPELAGAVISVCGVTLFFI
ncbi:MAG TPA: DMT family transporter [Bacteroidales bacterium]|nr:DMT family transporter [Bacteroidales bacterium]HPM86943.1 DMT family transporter [Bacteroidales bacterium]HQM67932.1 DMT family transporter [Bacteroidales bacterium]